MAAADRSFGKAIAIGALYILPTILGILSVVSEERSLEFRLFAAISIPLQMVALLRFGAVAFRLAFAGPVSMSESGKSPAIWAQEALKFEVVYVVVPSFLIVASFGLYLKSFTLERILQREYLLVVLFVSGADALILLRTYMRRRLR